MIDAGTAIISEDLWRLTAAELAAAYRAGRANPVTATQAHLARFDEVNPRLNAVVTIDRDAAMQAAAASAERWRRRAPRSALDGVPITVKDNLFVAGLLATWGSLLCAGHIASADELPVARLRDAGAIILGKTNTPELSLAGYTDNRLFGATGNPWAEDLSPGGSSGGAAASVVAGIGALALVTDAGGSTRRPAAHVGAVGLKASLGRVPRGIGFPPLSGDLQVVGQMGRTVADVRTMFACLALPAARTQANRALRIAAFCRIGAAPVDPEIEAAWRASLLLLSELGHTIEEITPPYDPDECGAILLKLGAVGVARFICHLPDWKTQTTPQIAALGDEGLRTSAVEYAKILDRIAQHREEAANLFASYDLIATPTTAGLLWPKTEPYLKEIAGRPASPRASVRDRLGGTVARRRRIDREPSSLAEAGADLTASQRIKCPGYAPAICCNQASAATPVRRAPSTTQSRDWQRRAAHENRPLRRRRLRNWRRSARRDNRLSTASAPAWQSRRETSAGF
jgi:aspartyl-tRNA(Asn)/glutamyl-tRNA(Gln) amidotransferase subunit A